MLRETKEEFIEKSKPGQSLHRQPQVQHQSQGKVIRILYPGNDKVQMW